MGTAVSPDIFQAKMNMLFNELEYIRAHIDDLFIITKGERPKDHVETEVDRD